MGGVLKLDTIRNVLIRDVLTPLKAKFPTPKGEIGFEHGRLHSFRHYFVSQAFLGGASEGEIRDWVGHPHSGLWHATTITKIGRDRINEALIPYGQRSMGDRKRFSPDGPRDLEEHDFRPDDKPKVIMNPTDHVITGPGAFAPLLSGEQIQELNAILDKRGESQRGKPRSRTPGKNPLGSRVFDMDCGWPMYRAPYQVGFRYTCAAYIQSKGSCCHHNHVDGPTAVRFVMSAVRQRALQPDRLQKLRQRIEAIARRELAPDRSSQQADAKRAQLKEVQSRRDRVGRNMAQAETDAQLAQFKKVFNELDLEEQRLQAGLDVMETKVSGVPNIEAEIDAAMNVARSLAELATNAVEDFSSAQRLFEAVNARLFLRFHEQPWGKRCLRKPASGVLTMGNEPPSIRLYNGLTGRESMKQAAATLAASPGQNNRSDPEKKRVPGWKGTR